MNKPITMSIKETKANLIKVCNDAGLSPAILDLIVYSIYTEIHALAERQAAEEENAYIQAIMAQQEQPAAEVAEEENN